MNVCIFNSIDLNYIEETAVLLVSIYTVLTLYVRN